MPKFVRVLIAGALLVAAVNSQATTWGTSTVKDPVSGKSLKVQEPMSSGSYIYGWPGKEDQVFWPFTTDHWLWFNPKSGYGAFGGDFGELKGADLERVKAWLAENYDASRPPETRLEKLAWLERLYGQRDMGDDFQCFWFRLMAFEYSQEDPARSLDYVRKAIPLLEKRLASGVADFGRITALYLLGEYHRRLCDRERSRDYFEQARAGTYKDEEGREQVGSPYINELIAEREALDQAPAPVSESPPAPSR